MAVRKRREFSAKFKADAVALVMTGSKTIGDVTRQYDLTETALRDWVKRAEADAGTGAPGALTTAERAELVDLRKRLKRAEMERGWHSSRPPPTQKAAARIALARS